MTISNDPSVHDHNSIFKLTLGTFILITFYILLTNFTFFNNGSDELVTEEPEMVNPFTSNVTAFVPFAESDILNVELMSLVQLQDNLLMHRFQVIMPLVNLTIPNSSTKYSIQKTVTPLLFKHCEEITWQYQQQRWRSHHLLPPLLLLTEHVSS
ncbi:hypothetical protein J3R30DRAFT_3421660 [Lentinula aciculospora]|uniref:Uncharacterized protein n=1 Tax=Lentinula aciculospora TaxID=153920 RepID=A0A9W9ATW7_9AGAR|nr:hypothetical protein J3R30DRAFT_3421660 [Lentinula aciculospora]